MRTKRGAWWLGVGMLIALGVWSCLPLLTGAPCSNDDNCPLSQHCVNGRCEAGPGSTSSGSDESVHSGVHELRCDDGLDDDADGLADCADPDCDGFTCRAVAGPCDVAERCLAGACPTDGFERTGLTCRPVVGACDLQESCAGGPRCPADFSSCPEGDYCEPTGCVPQRALGSACTQDVQCRSKSCVDGVCCDTRCEGGCEGCGTGTCTPTNAGAPGSPSCAPYLCDGTSSSCPRSCASSSQCASTAYCSASGTCVARTPGGAACTNAAQCASGFCVEGTCCDTACTGACNACNLDGAVGTCTPRAGPGNPSCAPYVCNGTVPGCPHSCTSDAHCVSTHYCSPTGTCSPRLGNGASCSSDTHCTSGACVDGVCCNSSCGGACVSCNQPGKLGTCTPRAAGSDPEGGCGAYTCDGAGACLTSCSPAGSCPAACGAGAFCTASARCGPRLAAGEPCAARCQCASDRCTTFFRDADGDGFGQAGGGEQRCGDSPPPGFSTSGTDCVDSNPQVHPGAPELPGDEVDSDCDGEELCYRDDDGDGFRLESTLVSHNLSCGDAHEARASEPTGDCCDSDADAHPGQTASFEHARSCGGLRYDYDCDGRETRCGRR